MPEKTCQNPNCQKTYHVNENDQDDGFCCYACWEEVNCKEPEKVVNKEFVLD
jgi:hypothetical protein